MRKKLIALLLFVLAGVAACGGTGDECSTDEDCADDRVCYLYMGTRYCVSEDVE